MNKHVTDMSIEELLELFDEDEDLMELKKAIFMILYTHKVEKETLIEEVKLYKQSLRAIRETIQELDIKAINHDMAFEHIHEVLEVLKDEI